MSASLRLKSFFAAQELIGSRVRRHYDAFSALERADREALSRLAGDRLAGLLRHAVREVPFYRDRVSGEGSALSDFPVVTRSDLQEHYHDFMTPALREAYERDGGRGRGYSWLEVKTGGTSGRPTTVIHDRSFRDQGRASRLYSQALCGFPFGTPYFRLWGSMAEINRMKAGRVQRLMAWLARERLMNAFQMDEAHMDRYLKRMRRGGVGHLMTYVDAARLLAGHAGRSKQSAPRLASIMSCAGTLTNDDRKLLGETFGARVHNKYGSRECTDMACECELGGFHIFSHHVHLETVDDQGQAVAAGGERGHLLVTLLGNHSFPLIRYRIGDMGRLGTASCECGRPFPLLEAVEGRAAEFLTATDGTVVSPAYVCHLIGVVHHVDAIRRFQLAQTGARTFRLSLEADPGASLEPVQVAILRDLKTVLGEDASIECGRVDRIPVPASGKFLFTVNEQLQGA